LPAVLPLLYGDQQLEQIASAIRDGSDLEKLKPFRERFQDAAFCYYASQDRSRLLPDKELSEIEALANACARFIKFATIRVGSGTAERSVAPNRNRNLSTAAKAILRRLGADKGSWWEDGLPDRKLALLLSDNDFYELDDRALRSLAAAIENHEANLMAAAAAVEDLAKRVRRGRERVKRVRGRSVQRGNSGNTALNIWIADHMTIYQAITGRYPSRGTKGTPREPGGPLLRFLRASAEFVGIKLSDHAFDQRVLRAQRAGRPARK
jgi:hypothetical protein